MILLDTHIWIWLNDASHLVPRGMSVKLAGSPLALSVVSIWEAMMLLDKGRLRSALPPEQTVRTWLTNPVRIIDLTPETAILARTLVFAHEDPADRFIAATAYHLQVPLATSDQRLFTLPWLKTIT